MAQSQQPTAQQLQAIQNAKNSAYMQYSYEQPVLANNLNGTQFGQGRTINFEAPIISGAWATKVKLIYDLNIHVVEGASATVPTPNAGFPENLINNVEVKFGNKVINANPAIFKIFDKMEGWNRTTLDDVVGHRDSVIDGMLRQVPTTLVAGDNKLHFTREIMLNMCHESSVNGILPIFANGTRLQVALQLPSAVVGPDPLDNCLNTADATVTVTGDVRAQIVYRDFTSFTSVDSVQPDISGLATPQLIQLPTLSSLQPGVLQTISVRNPYQFSKIVHFIIDGKQSDRYASPDNILNFRYDKAENNSSAFWDYETTGGMESYYRDYVRAKFGQDLDAGVLVFDSSTANVANASSKMGVATLNLSSNGYPSMRAGFKVGAVDGSKIAPRVVSYGVILNPDGIKVL